MARVRAENINAQLRRFPSCTEVHARIERLGGATSVSTISRVFSTKPGQQRWPTEETAKWIARALGIKTGQFYSLLEQRRAYHQD